MTDVEPQNKFCSLLDGLIARAIEQDGLRPEDVAWCLGMTLVDLVDDDDAVKGLMHMLLCLHHEVDELVAALKGAH